MFTGCNNWSCELPAVEFVKRADNGKREGFCKRHLTKVLQQHNLKRSDLKATRLDRYGHNMLYESK